MTLRRFGSAFASSLLIVAVLLFPGASGAAAGGSDPIGGPLLGSPGVVVAPLAPPTPAAPTARAPTSPAPSAAAPLAQSPLTLAGLPTVSASSWLVADLDTGEVLAAKAAHQRLRPASTLKVLTALALLPELDPAATYLGTAEDANAEGSRAGIFPGATYTIEALWYGLFLISGNDAARALAMAAGGMDSAVAQMNAVASTLQAADTTAVNPSGLDADGQLSSAYDLALFARAGMARDDFARYASTLHWSFPGKVKADGSPGETFQLWNQNTILVNYPETIAAKSGYTTLAQNTYIAVAERDGHRLVATLMHSHHGVWKEARALLQWGFEHRESVQPVGVLVDPLPQGAPPPSASSSPSSGAAAAGLALPDQASTSATQSDSSPSPAWPVAGLAAGAAAAVVVFGRRRRRRRRPQTLRPGGRS